MSQFRDTFMRGSKKDPLLSYDDFASRIFTSGFMTCFLLPITFYAFKKWFGPKTNGLPSNLKLADIHIEDRKTPSTHCKCSYCTKQRIKEHDGKFKLSEHLSPSRLLQLFLLLFFWWIVFTLITGVNPDDNIKRFDPFQLLGLTTDATKKDIQKAYRHLSLKYHPDRNPNDPEMSAHFTLITKAYRTLTNEKSRMNYARYGNPDGPGMMKIGIGLPRFDLLFSVDMFNYFIRFLVDENNQIVILTILFLFILIVMPSLFIYYSKHHKLYTATGIRIETLQLVYYSMSENTRHKALPEVYACSTECCQIPYRSSDDAALKRYNDVIGDYKRKNITRETFRNFVLLLCQLNRVTDLTPSLLATQKEILKYSMLITQCMLDVSVCKGWILTIKSILDFRRSIIHGISGKSETFLQIPHFDENVVSHIQKGKNAIKRIEDFVVQSPEEQRGIAKMSKEQMEDVTAFCKIFPRAKLEVSVCVTDEDDIYLHDLVTVNIVFTRLNIPEGHIAGPVHAPHFPWVKYEEWSLMLNYKDEDRSIAFKFVKSNERVSEHSLQFIAERVGTNNIVVTALCDSYFGCDKSASVEFTVKPITYQYESKIHPDDLALDHEPSAIGKIFGELLAQDESEDEEIVQCD